MLSDRGSPRQVLIVDDYRPIHEDFRKILGTNPLHERLDGLEYQLFGGAPATMSQASYQLHSAMQGQQAYEIVQARTSQGAPIELAFIDMRMPPGWDGMETIDHLWEVDPDIQMVICTAYSDYSWTEIAQHFGRRDNLLILRKPFDNVEVLQIAASLTEKRRLGDLVRRKCVEMETTIHQRGVELRTRASALRQRQKLESVGLIAAGVSQRCANAVNSVCDSLRQAIDVAHRDSKVAEFHDAALRGAEWAARWASQLEDFCRPKRLQRTSIDIGQVIRECAEMIQPFFDESVRFDLAHCEVGAIVAADRVSMQQVFVNLSTNARDAMPAGGVISVAVRRMRSMELATSSLSRCRGQALPDELVSICVSDTGHGIPAKLRDRIFEPFFTTKEFGSRSGLGLSTVNDIVREHDGWIEFESDTAKGTSFVIYLPAQADVADTSLRLLPADMVTGSAK